METAPNGKGQEEKASTSLPVRSWETAPLCLGSPPPLHCQVFTMATSFQTRGTEHISIWCWGAREAQREWEWGPATPPLIGQGPGLALTQVYSHFPRPALSALSMRIWTREGHHKDEGKESGHMEPGLPSCSISVGPLEAAGLEGGPGVHTVPHYRDLQTCSMRE